MTVRTRSRWLWLVVACLNALGASADEAVELATPRGPLSIAVAPFQDGVASSGNSGSAEVDVASLLATRLAQRLPTSVVAPSAFNASFDTAEAPEARAVREWAREARVDAVVFGRTLPAEGGVDVAVEVRSGHSGVATANHELVLLTAADPSPAVDALAESILDELGYQPPAVPAAAVDDSEEGRSAFNLLKRGKAISINSDELEVTQEGDERHLIFRRAVQVEQGDVRMSTDRLDAYYKKGESQPDRLVASGSVRVDFGERRASCDVATFYNTERRVTCAGHASLQQGCDLVRGLEIQFDLREERVRVIGAASVVIQEGEDGHCAGEQL